MTTIRANQAALATERREDAPSGLFMNSDGAWFHDGDPITHARLATLLSKCVARDDDGKLAVTTGRDRLTFVAEDAPYQVRTLQLGDEVDGITLVLSDGTQELLTAASRLCIDDDGRIRSAIKGQTEWALWGRGPSQLLASRLDDDEHVALGTGTLRLERTAARTWSARP